MFPIDIKWKWVMILVIFILVSVAAVGLTGWSLGTIPEGRFAPEIALTILLVSGVVSLVAVLAIAVTILSALGLSDNTRAFGMPEGSIRAVIALGLIIIFAIVTVFLYSQMNNPDTTTLVGLTKAQLNEIPITNMISSKPSDVGTDLFDVQFAIRNESSEDFAQQILTMVGTLVVAVASFYFGTQNVSVARGMTTPSLPFIRKISVIDGKQGEEKELEISGKNFISPKTIKFVHISSKSEMTVQDILTNNAIIKCKLNIPVSQDPGYYDLVVINSDGGEDNLTKAFEVKEKK